MPSGQQNLAENKTPRDQNPIPIRPVAPASAGKNANENAHSEKQLAAAEAKLAAFVWLFGSGCY